MAYPRYQRYSETQSSDGPESSPDPFYEPPRRRARGMRGAWLEAIGLTPVTFVLIVINVVVFALQNIPFTAVVMDYQGLSLWSLENGMWWTLLTSMFMHGSIMHILFNMVALYCFGPTMERIFGPLRFTILYVGAGIVGGFVFVAVSYFTLTLSVVVGASGAIFGLFGAYGVLLLREWKRPVLLAGRPTTQSLTSYFGLIVINLLVSLSPGIAMESHVGGFVSGALIGLLLYALEVRSLRADEAFGRLS